MRVVDTGVELTGYCASVGLRIACCAYWANFPFWRCTRIRVLTGLCTIDTQFICWLKGHYMNYAGSLLITFMRSVKPTGIWSAVRPLGLHRIVGKVQVRCISTIISLSTMKKVTSRTNETLWSIQVSQGSKYALRSLFKNQGMS